MCFFNPFILCHLSLELFLEIYVEGYNHAVFGIEENAEGMK
jgi:hypothetical protein